MLTLVGRGAAKKPGVARTVLRRLRDRFLIGEPDVETWSPETIREGYKGLVREIPGLESAPRHHRPAEFVPIQFRKRLADRK